MSRAVRILVGCYLVAASAAGWSTGAGAQDEAAEPAGWILVDAKSGDVLGGARIHRPLPAASIGLLMTALVTMQRLPTTALDPDQAGVEKLSPGLERNPVLVTRDAVQVPPPKLGISQGARWDVKLLLNGILLGEANDAAYALAETGSGNPAAFAGDMNSFGHLLGLQDSTWTDPLADDDNAATPNLTSAWDLAAIARASLRIPELRSILEDKEETINGPQLGRRVVNSNELVQRYPGATGLKQGVSEKAGGVLVGSAERDGRELIVVVLGTPGDPVSFAVEKLDAAFAAGRSRPQIVDPVRPAKVATAQARLEALVNLPPSLGNPRVALGAAGSQAPRTVETRAPSTRPTSILPESDGGGGGVFTLVNLLIAVMFGGIVTLIVLRRRTISQQQRKRVVRQRQFHEAKRRGSIDFVDPDQETGSSHVKILRPGEHESRR